MTQVWSVTCHIVSQTILSANGHKWTHPTLTQSMQAGTRFTYPRFTCPGGMEDWVDLVDLIAPWPGVEPATFRSRVWHRTD